RGKRNPAIRRLPARRFRAAAGKSGRECRCSVPSSYPGTYKHQSRGHPCRLRPGKRQGWSRLCLVLAAIEDNTSGIQRQCGLTYRLYYIGCGASTAEPACFCGVKLFSPGGAPNRQFNGHRLLAEVKDKEHFVAMAPAPYQQHLFLLEAYGLERSSVQARQ